MVDNTKRYFLNLRSDKCEFPLLKNLNNKHLKQSLVAIRNNFKKNDSIIRCKNDVEHVVAKSIPADFFGCKKNKKLFIHLVRKILNHGKGEFLHISLLTKGFQRKFDWLKLVENKEYNDTLRDVNLYLLEKCIKPFIRRNFFPLFQGKSYKIDLIPKCKWQFFRDRIFQQMISMGHVKLIDDNAGHVPRGALRILPKDECESSNYRAVICYFRKSETEENFKYICRIKQKLKIHVKATQLHSRKFCDSWEDFVEKSVSNTVYGIKADVKDSFGNINIDKLSLVIQGLPGRILTDKDKSFLIDRIQNQYITFNNAKNRIVIRWCHGLLQGDRMSSVLCDLYYLVLIDQKLLKNYLVGNFFFHRTVDDYIFCSTNRETAEAFISSISAGLVLNQDKIFLNLGSHKHVELPYCGYIFNLCTKQVCIGYNMKNFNLSDKIKLWHDCLFSSPDEYLTTIMQYSSANFYFSKVIFNTHYNNEETILKLYFQSMIYMGMKFHCAFSELRQYHKDYCSNHFIVMKKILDIIRQYSEITFNIIGKHKGNLFYGDIKCQMLVSIGARAFILVLNQYVIYKVVIALLKKTVFMRIDFFGSMEISYFNKIPQNMCVKNLK